MEGAAADPWLTLVGYFNSLRDLGGMRRAVDDTIMTRLPQMVQRGLAKRYLRAGGVEEMTSRKSATDIPLILDRLEAPFPPPVQTKEKGKEKPPKVSLSARPIDVLLATNMTSVGVDVGRLGLMVVAGQPKATAEYIQATSRVGRQDPGLVLTVYNWTRPRDLSHYERFGHYHATFYEQVEALSVTPFSPRALDRGLTAVLVALVRLAGLELNENAAAESITADHPLVRAAVAELSERATSLNGNPSGQLVASMLNARIDDWISRKNQVVGARLGYQEKRDGQTVGLLKAPGEERWDALTCPNSLRDVEPPVNLLLRDDGKRWGSGPAWQFGTPTPDPEAEENAELVSQDISLQ